MIIQVGRESWEFRRRNNGWNYEKDKNCSNFQSIFLYLVYSFVLIFISLLISFLRENQARIDWIKSLASKGSFSLNAATFPFFHTAEESQVKTSVLFHVSMPFPSTILVKRGNRTRNGFHARESARTRFRELELQGRQGPPPPTRFCASNHSLFVLIMHRATSSACLLFYSIFILSRPFLLVSSEFRRSKFIISLIIFTFSIDRNPVAHRFPVKKTVSRYVIP